MEKVMDSTVLFRHVIDSSAVEIVENSRFAAVAIIVLLNTNQLPEVLLIKRTSHPDDPWSGQIGLPGGHQENIDGSLLNTAIRETTEETGIQLSETDFIAQIGDQQGYANAGKINLTVRPFLFTLDKTPAVSTNYELEKYYWVPLQYLQHPDNHLYFKPMLNFSERPGVQIDGDNILWGMTYRILTDFFIAAKMDAPFITEYDRQVK